ncbi:MAG TPA: tail fiber domain-containing protein, partial [Erysipelotrichaceae bacterium]|nr:tail fiber domain-containing protein [Erysipelotrichaceae bacterium]
FIMKLRPVTYKWKDGKRDHLGFIAQDVKRAMDETGFDAGVYIDPTMSSDFSQNEEQTAHYKGIRYSELIAPLVQTVQIQQNLINELIKRIDALEAQEV